MSSPLALAYNWQLPAVAWTAGAVLTLCLLAYRHPPGWVPVALAVVLIWAFFVGLVLLRARAYLETDGSRLTVRRFRDKQTINGPDIVRVTEFLTSRGPCHRLTVNKDGRTVRYTVPTALLRAGHSTLFTWLLAHAPRAELDKSSRRTLERLRTRGLVE